MFPDWGVSCRRVERAAFRSPECCGSLTWLRAWLQGAEAARSAWLAVTDEGVLHRKLELFRFCLFPLRSLCSVLLSLTCHQAACTSSCCTPAARLCPWCHRIGAPFLSSPRVSQMCPHGSVYDSLLYSTRCVDGVAAAGRCWGTLLWASASLGSGS